MAITLPLTPTITASNQTATTVDLSWQSSSATGTLTYLVYALASSNIALLDTIAECQSAGTVKGSAQSANFITVTGLTANTNYVFNVIPLENGISETNRIYTSMTTATNSTPASTPLKDEFFEGSYGIVEKMKAVFEAGQAFVASNRATILSGMQAAASAGKNNFTISIETNFETANLRLQGKHMDTYFAGIVAEFASEFIYSYEVVPTLDDSDTSDLFVILTFTL